MQPFLKEPEKIPLELRLTPSIITPIFGQQFENATLAAGAWDVRVYRAVMIYLGIAAYLVTTRVIRYYPLTGAIKQ